MEKKSAQVAYLSSGWRAKIEGSSESDSGLVDMPPHQFAHLKVIVYAPNCAFENRLSFIQRNVVARDSTELPFIPNSFDISGDGCFEGLPAVQKRGSCFAQNSTLWSITDKFPKRRSYIIRSSKTLDHIY